MTRFPDPPDRAGHPGPRADGVHRRVPALLPRPRARQVARTFAGRLATPARIAQIKHELHLDQPLVRCSTALTGRGTCCTATSATTTTRASRWHGDRRRPSRSRFRWSSGPRSSGSCYGVFTGIISAVRSRSLMDRIFTASALFFYSMPTFVLGLSLIWIFAYKLSSVTTFFPVHGYVPVHHEPGPVVRVPDPALAHAGPGDRGHLYPADPRRRCWTYWARTTSGPPGPRA